MDSSPGNSTFGLNIRRRLFLGFLALAVPLVIVMGVFLSKIKSIESSTEHVLQVTLPTSTVTSNLGTTVYAAQTSMLDWLLTNNATSKKNWDIAWQDIQDQRKELDALSGHWSSAAFAKAWDELKVLYTPFLETQTKVMNLPRNEELSKTALPIINEELRPIRSKIIDLIEGQRSTTGKREGGMGKDETDILMNTSGQIRDDIVTLKYFSYGLLAVTILLCTFISLLTANRILGPLNNAISIAKRIASGERNIEIHVSSRDETGELLKALDLMQTSIRTNEDNIKKNEEKTKRAFEEIVRTAEQFSSHSSKLASGDLRQRLEITKQDVLSTLGKDLNEMTNSMSNTTKQIMEASAKMTDTLNDVKESASSQSTAITEQAASINEITSSLEEIDKSSKQTMQKAQNLGEMAKQTREKGTQGILAVEKSIQGMKALRERVQTIAQTILDLSNQTQQVGEITAIVNTLAQQSKMLALNASIEAAKAGEAGRGFAVVAIEVKNLAEQSEQSTAQVQKILEDIRRGAEKAVMVTEEGTKGVDEGAKLIEKASEVISGLNDAIHETSLASQQIEGAIRQEGISIDQITSAMTEINNVTNSFVSGVKETTSAINFLADIERKLKEHISVYKVQ